MKKTLFSTCLILFTVSVLYLSDSFAQDYAQWHLPEGAKTRLGKGKINEIQLSPDGARLAVATSIGIWLYDVHGGEELDLLIPMKNVSSISFSLDAAMLASGSRNGTIHLWDANTGKDIKTLIGHNDRITSVAFNPDGRTLASGSWDKTIHLWDTATGEQIKTLRCGEILFGLAFSPDGATLASVGNYPPPTLLTSGAPSPFLADPGSFICLWDVATGNRRLTTDTGVYSLAFSPDGATLASGSSDKTIRLWDTTTGKHIQKLSGHTDAVSSLAFSPDGATLVSGSWDKTIRLWDTTTGEHIQKLSGHSGGVSSLAFSPDGTTLASGSWDKAILWDAATGKHTRSLKRHTKQIDGLMFGFDGATLVSLSQDKTIRLWDAATGSNFKTFSGYMDSIENIALSPDGATLAIADHPNTGSYIYLWDTATGKHIKTLSGHTTSVYSRAASVYSLAFSPDSATLAGGGYGYIHLWDVATKEHIKTFAGKDWIKITDLVFSPDGATLAWNSYGGSTNLWDVATKEHMKTLFGHSGGVGVNSLAFSPDGTTLASGNSYMTTIRLWDATTGEYIKTLSGHTDRVNSLAFSPNGTILASGGYGKITLWNVLTGEHIRMLKAHKSWIRGLAFSLDGTTLASGHTRDIDHSYEDVTTGSLWNVATGEHIKMLTTTHSLGPYRVSFNTDGATLASTDWRGGIVLLWDLDAAPLVPEGVPEDVNKDGIVNIQDLTLVAANFGQTGPNAADVNGDGIVDIRDLVKVASAMVATVAAPSTHPQALAMLTAAEVREWLTQAQQLNLTDAISQRGIRFLEQLLDALTPKETALLPNYPNPFNPETWIPYQLAEPAEVTVTIYAVDGTVVRTLELGHQPIGIYQTHSRAAHWDGKNELGESGASGVYFYTLTAGEFKATRKMVIRK